MHGASGGVGIGGGVEGRGGKEGGGNGDGFAGGSGADGGEVYVYVVYPEQWQHAISGVTSTAKSFKISRIRVTLLHGTFGYSIKSEAHVSLVGSVDPEESCGANHHSLSWHVGGGAVGGWKTSGFEGEGLSGGGSGGIGFSGNGGDDGGGNGGGVGNDFNPGTEPTVIVAITGASVLALLRNKVGRATSTARNASKRTPKTTSSAKNPPVFDVKEEIPTALCRVELFWLKGDVSFTRSLIGMPFLKTASVVTFNGINFICSNIISLLFSIFRKIGYGPCS